MEILAFGKLIYTFVSSKSLSCKDQVLPLTVVREILILLDHPAKTLTFNRLHGNGR